MITSDEFPREITFKTIFRSECTAREYITGCLCEKGLNHAITEKASGGGKFVSYTITAHFESEDVLNDVCVSIKTIEGYMMMI